MESAVSSHELAAAVNAHLLLASRMISDFLPTATGFGVLSELDRAASQLDSDGPDAARAWLSSLHAVT